MTMLGCAIYWEKWDIARLLLEHGADINICDNKDRKTALMSACSLGCDDGVKLLLEKGADITIADKEGNTALTYAIQHGHNDIVKLLVAADPNFMWNIIMEEQKEEWKKLLGSDRLKHVDFETFKEFFKQLIEHPNKAEWIDYKDDEFEDGWTMLHCSIFRGRLDIASLLLEHGADINIGDKDGKTALMLAVHKDAVNWLLEHGADITIADKKGKTALMKASIQGNTNKVKLLLEKGADITIMTALAYAIQEGQTDIVKLLSEKVAAIQCPR